MSTKILALIGTALMSGSAVAQQTLYSNPYDPAGSNDCGFSSGCQTPGSISDAQLFTLGSAATVQSVSFTAIDPRMNPQNSYEWSIYTDVGGLPAGPPGPLLGGNVTVTPLASGQAFLPGSGETNVYSSLNIGSSADGLIDTYTISIGSVTLGAGNYFLALEGFGSETSFQGWMQGLNDSGAASSSFGIWSPGSTGGMGGLAMTVHGTYAPEIDPSLGIGGLTLLFGGLAVLRGRRPATSAA
jgi:hypothetical protein